MEVMGKMGTKERMEGKNVEGKEEMEKAKKPGAKDFSLLAQVVAALWVAVWSGAKFVAAIREGNLGAISVGDVMLSGAGIAACFSPVYFSILMDKLKGIVKGE